MTAAKKRARYKRADGSGPVCEAALSAEGFAHLVPIDQTLCGWVVSKAAMAAEWRAA